MRLIAEPGAFRRSCDEARAAGRRVGLVPTMGAVHVGHLSLVEEARRRGCDHVALTIFVNPLQFAPHEDFDRYPRSLEEDLAACREAGVDVVFAPPSDGMYPKGFSTRVAVDRITEPLEGLHRPGHFEGVTTVVAKLFGLTGPSVAVFGRKDYQQWKTLERMARDLDMPIEVVGAPIVREPDGLALSSRNRYLSAEQRARALGIVAGLQAAEAAFATGERRTEALLALARRPVEARFDRIDYVALADPEDLTPRGELAGERAVLAVAAHLGATRLIDNVVLGA